MQNGVLHASSLPRGRNSIGDAHRDMGAPAGDQRPVELVVDLDTDGYALGDLYPVAGGVLRRQQRELPAGAGIDADDMALETSSGNRVELDLGALADAELVELGFLEIGVDPIAMIADDIGE